MRGNRPLLCIGRVVQHRHHAVQAPLGASHTKCVLSAAVARGTLRTRFEQKPPYAIVTRGAGMVQRRAPRRILGLQQQCSHRARRRRRLLLLLLLLLLISTTARASMAQKCGGDVRCAAERRNVERRPAERRLPC